MVYFSVKAQQNLVPDGGFELFSTCPNGQGIIYFSPYWFYPTQGSSDLFNACQTNTALGVGVPLNGFGYQNPHSGLGYSGGGLKEGTYNGDYKEYVSSGLIAQLKKDHIYNVSFFISLSDNSTLALNRISVLFTNDSILNYKSLFTTMPLLPQINFICNGCFFSDTSNWVKLETNYLADGTEKFITIGNFIVNNQQLFSVVLPDTSGVNYSYYYFDDVSLIDITDTGTYLPNIFTPNFDNVNDVFSFKVFSEVRKVEIFNRWGLRVFETNSPKNFWDGRTTSGTECGDGIYYYVIDTETKKHKGFVQLVR